MVVIVTGPNNPDLFRGTSAQGALIKKPFSIIVEGICMLVYFSPVIASPVIRLDHVLAISTISVFDPGLSTSVMSNRYGFAQVIPKDSSFSHTSPTCDKSPRSRNIFGFSNELELISCTKLFS